MPSANAAMIFPLSDSASHQASGRSTAVRYSVLLDRNAQTLELTPFPFFGSAKRRRFAYASPDPNQLTLTGEDDEGSSVVVSLRRFDPAGIPAVVLAAQLALVMRATIKSQARRSRAIPVPLVPR